jgi:hypothetical protein
MKLKKGLHSAAIFTVIIFCSSGFTGRWPLPQGKLYGLWQYSAIYKNGKNILIPSGEDTMLLNPTKSIFHYHIKSLNKSFSGAFQTISSPLDSSPYQTSLWFQYSPSKGIRRFHIMALNDDSLVIREGHTTFHYRRNKP